MVGGIIPLRWAQSSRYGGRLRPESAKNLEHHHRIERRTATLRSLRIRKRRVEFRPERLEIHHNPKGLELVTKVAQTLQPIIDIKKTRLVAHRIVSHPPPGWNQKCSNLARFLEPSSSVSFDALALLDEHLSRIKRECLELDMPTANGRLERLGM